jgi:hypothetical protein
MRTLVSVMLTVLFVLSHWGWLSREIVPDYNNFLAHKDSLSIDYRMEARFGNGYGISKGIAGALKTKGGSPESDLVLIPMAAYFKKQGVVYPAPEPAVFYYYTGVKTINPRCQGARSARWVVLVNNHQIVFRPIPNPRVADSLIRALQ